MSTPKPILKNPFPVQLKNTFTLSRRQGENGRGIWQYLAFELLNAQSKSPQQLSDLKYSFFATLRSQNFNASMSASLSEKNEMLVLFPLIATSLDEQQSQYWADFLLNAWNRSLHPKPQSDDDAMSVSDVEESEVEESKHEEQAALMASTHGKQTSYLGNVFLTALENNNVSKVIQMWMVATESLKHYLTGGVIYVNDTQQQLRQSDLDLIMNKLKDLSDWRFLKKLYPLLQIKTINLLYRRANAISIDYYDLLQINKSKVSAMDFTPTKNWSVKR